MRNITDIIEQYLKNMINKSPDAMVEIQRNELAEQFQCVPSQINYVISTRFTIEKGYLVESKRGGGGYIRIQKLQLPNDGELDLYLFRSIGNQIDQTSAEGLIYQLEDAKLISPREANLFKAAIKREVLAVKLPLRDELRAKIMKSMLIALLSK